MLREFLLLTAFHEVFNLFDINGGGTIDANELDSALKSVDIQLTRREIEDVLHVIDEDGNGEIDFEEFLTLMTSTEKYLATLKGTAELCCHVCEVQLGNIVYYSIEYNNSDNRVKYSLVQYSIVWRSIMQY